MASWRTVSIILKFFAAFVCACAAALTALGASEESQNPVHQEDRLVTSWTDDILLVGNFAILAVEGIFCIVALLLALMLVCKKFPKPSTVEFVLLLLGTVLLLLAFGTEAWYSTCYDGAAADAAKAQGDICVVQGWVSASVALCAATVIYGVDAFIWYFCRKRRVTWIGWYYDDSVWEIPPNGDEEKEKLAENEEKPAEDDPERPQTARSENGAAPREENGATPREEPPREPSPELPPAQNSPRFNNDAGDERYRGFFT